MYFDISLCKQFGTYALNIHITTKHMYRVFNVVIMRIMGQQ